MVRWPECRILLPKGNEEGDGCGSALEAEGGVIVRCTLGQ